MLFIHTFNPLYFLFVCNTKPYTHFNPYEGERKGINSKEFLILVIECSYVFDKIVKDFKEMTFTKSNRKVTGDYGMDEKKDRNLKGEHQGRKTGKGEKRGISLSAGSDQEKASG